MLKAVRFDEKKHKGLLDFITSYRDKKGRNNESEAIRFLMQTGLDKINDKTKEIYLNESVEKEDEREQIDINVLKKELYAEIMSEISSSTLSSLTMAIEKLNNIQPVYIQQPKYEQDEQNKADVTINSTRKPMKKQNNVKIPEDASQLLANILSNANR